MPRTLISYKKEKITIADNALYSGGEGAIHTVLGMGKKRVAKLYHSPEKAQAFHQKIHFMVNNPPFGQADKAISDAIVWPEDLLFENNVFVGYVMPMVEGGIKLFMLTLPDLSVRDNPLTWAKFSPANPDSLLIRLKICYNLARAVDLLHQSGKYVLVDLKPENVLIKPNGHFSIIDLDSIQIIRNNLLLFHATAFTPEYTPAELHNGSLVFGRDVIPASFDLFSLAVTNYQLLLNIHPFQASHDKYTSIEENIRYGLFVQGSRKKQLAVIPSIHGRFGQLPVKLQKFFIKALEHGYMHPNSRPSATEWADVLFNEITAYSPGRHSLFQTKFHTARALQKKQGTRPAFHNTVQPVLNLDQNYARTKANINGMINNAFSGFKRDLQMQAKLKPSFLQTNIARKFAAIALILICSTILVFSFTSIKALRNGKAEATLNISMPKQLSGKYFGLISNSNGAHKVAYLQLYQSDADSMKFAIRLLDDVLDSSVIEELIVDPHNNSIHSESLGKGIFKLDSKGKIVLKSNTKNPLSWHFEK